MCSHCLGPLFVTVKLWTFVQIPALFPENFISSENEVSAKIFPPDTAASRASITSLTSGV